MPKIHNEHRKAELALALARGGTVTEWAKNNDVPERTAFTWARCREVLDEVDAIRRAATETAVGCLSESATAAAREIVRLMQEANSEAVRLSAARAVLADLMTVSNYAALERRLADLERRIASQTGQTVPPPPATDDGQCPEGEDEDQPWPAC
jgi:hypothetical protein